MTFEAKFEKHLYDDEDTSMPVYDRPVVIKALIYGKNIFLYGNGEEGIINSKVYLTMEKVEPGDKLDGFVVKTSNNYPVEWDDSVTLYEVMVW